MTTYMRYGLLGMGALALALAAGFVLQISWATALVPWASSPLSNIFLGSILAAIGAPLIWIGISQEWAGIVGGGINLTVQFAGWALFALGAWLAKGAFPVLCLVCFQSPA